jgi:hypothetical protein
MHRKEEIKLGMVPLSLYLATINSAIKLITVVFRMYRKEFAFEATRFSAALRLIS